ncbi:hypothetical protein VP01_1603g3 [Puccinia sorghi]|uniref:Uncharacterized protein n=1 Tax=Puccinia sorghi TaxID=27349 RepID=A0A0L6VJ47_9BASI|nr:hypothetical protein VP01_1603g3 [Puccinia sorghi]
MSTIPNIMYLSRERVDATVVPFQGITGTAMSQLKVNKLYNHFEVILFVIARRSLCHLYHHFEVILFVTAQHWLSFHGVVTLTHHQTSYHHTRHFTLIRLSLQRRTTRRSDSLRPQFGFNPLVSLPHHPDFCAEPCDLSHQEILKLQPSRSLLADRPQNNMIQVECLSRVGETPFLKFPQIENFVSDSTLWWLRDLTSNLYNHKSIENQSSLILGLHIDYHCIIAHGLTLNYYCTDNLCLVLSSQTDAFHYLFPLSNCHWQEVEFQNEVKAVDKIRVTEPLSHFDSRDRTWAQAATIDASDSPAKVLHSRTGDSPSLFRNENGELHFENNDDELGHDYYTMNEFSGLRAIDAGADQNVGRTKLHFYREETNNNFVPSTCETLKRICLLWELNPRLLSCVGKTSVPPTQLTDQNRLAETVCCTSDCITYLSLIKTDLQRFLYSQAMLTLKPKQWPNLAEPLQMSMMSNLQGGYFSTIIKPTGFHAESCAASAITTSTVHILPCLLTTSTARALEQKKKNFPTNSLPIFKHLSPTWCGAYIGKALRQAKVNKGKYLQGFC